MRMFAVYLTLLLLLLVSIGAGYVASDWPVWCRRAHLCVPSWPPPLGSIRPVTPGSRRPSGRARVMLHPGVRGGRC